MAEPAYDRPLRDAMAQNNLAGEPAGPPFATKRAIVAALVNAGVIRLEDA